MISSDKMFGLIHGVWANLYKKTNYYVLILGLDNSGKSTFLEQARCMFNKSLKRLDLRRIAPTVGLNVAKIETSEAILNFWDLGGQKELQTLWSRYFTEAHAVIWVVDSSEPERFTESREALRLLLEDEHLKQSPFLFIMNKQDKPEAQNPQEILNYFNLVDLIGDRHFISISTSAIEGQGLRGAIEWIADKIKISFDPTDFDDYE